MLQKNSPYFLNNSYSCHTRTNTNATTTTLSPSVTSGKPETGRTHQIRVHLQHLGNKLKKEGRKKSSALLFFL